MDIPLPGEVIPFPSSSPSRISKSPPPIPPPPPDFDHIPLPPSLGKQHQSPPTVNHLPKVPPLPPVAPPLPTTAGKNFSNLPPLPASQKGSPTVEPKGNGEAILWSSIPPPPAPAPPPEDSRYSPSHATPADEENERVLLPPSFTMLPPPPPPSDHAHLPASLRSPPNLPANPPLPPSRPLLHPSQPDPPSLPTPPPKTAVLGKMQAKKRLLAFSMTKQGGGLGLSFGFAKSTRVVNKASANAFVGSGEDEEISEKKEVMNKTRKKKKEEREVLAIEEIKREEERLKEALGIRQQAQRAEQWAEEMWGISPPVHEMMLPSLGAPAAPTGEDRDIVTAGEGSAVAVVDASVPTGNLEGGGAATDSHHNSELEPNIVGDTVNTESSNNAEHGEGAKGKGDGVEGKEERKEGSERRDKKGERSSRKKDKEGGERSRRREEEGGDKERSKRERGSGGRSGRERRSERKRESRRANDGPLSGWKQIKEAGGEWNRERTSHRPGNREDRGRERRSSRSHRSRSRDQKRSAHSAHRSRSRSTDVHRRPQASPFFVAKGAKHGEKEFPLRLLRHTRTRPPLSFCENPETAAPPRPTTRREAFASEPPDVVRIMRLVAEAGLEKETEGKEQAGEASGLAALRVSYEGGDEDEGEDEQKRSDRPWFPDVSAFLSESVALARVPHENAVSEEDGLSTRDQEEESKNDYNTVPEDTITVKKENANEEQENMNAEEEEEEEEEEENKDKRLLLNEPESTVHSRWDSDPDSRGVAVPDTGEKSTPLSDTVEMQQEASIEDEAKRVDDQNEFDEFPEAEGESETDENEESENTAEDSEGEEKKDQQLASEYEEFMKAVSVGGEEDEDEDDDDGGADGGGDWGSGGDEEEVESCEASDHQESDSSEHNSVVQNDAVGANSSDVELGSDVPSSEEAAATGRKIIKQSSSDSENNVAPVAKEKLGSESSKAAFTKEKAAKKKDKGKKDDFDSGGESEGEMQVPRKKRKLSSKKLMGVGEVAKRRGSEERKRKLKVKEKSQKRKREKDKRRKKKKERRKKKGRRRDDSSEVDSDSEEVSDDAKVTGSAKAGRAKLSESGNRKRSHKSEQSSEEMTSDNSSESSEGEDRRRLRKKKRKKRKKHVKMDGRREKEEGASEEDDQGKKNKVHSGKKRRGREGKSKRAGSDNSDCSEERDEQFSMGDEKSKVNAVGDDSLTGKENGLEDGSGKRGKKQKLKERERKKKRKGSPLNAKKHGSSRRRSPSTSDGSPTPGRGSHIRENVVSKVQGSRGGTNESGQSSVDSNSSGGSKKPVDNTTEENRPIESLHYWENSRVEVSRYHEESRTTICEKTRELGDSLSTSSSATLLIGKNSGNSIHKDKEMGCSALTVKKNIQDAVAKRIIAECALNISSSSSPSSLSLSSISSSSSMDSSCSVSSQSDSMSASSSTSSSSSASSSASSLSSSSSSSESSSSVSSFQCSPLSSKADSAFSEEPESRILLKDRISVENLKDSSKSSILSGSPESYLADLSRSPLSKEGFILQNEHLDNVSHVKLEPDSLHNRANSKPSVKEVKENTSLKVKSESSSGDCSLSRIDASSDVGHNPVRQYCETSKSTERVEPMDIFPCRQVIANEKFSFGLTSQPEQSEEHSMSKSACKPQIGFRESKLSTSDYEPSAFKISSEDQSDGRSVTATGQRMTLLPSRPSRWDTRPGISGTHAMGSGVVRGVTQEWDTPLAVPGLPILPVPFPTCQNKPLDEIPLPPQGVPRPVASPWGLEATTKKSALPVLSSSDLSINPIRGLADSTISDSDLVGRCIGGGFGGQLQVGLTSSPPAFSVALERPLVADNRTISSEGDQMVELFPRESDHFVQTREGMTLYKESGQQLHSADDKLMDHVVGAFSVDEHCLAKKANSSSPNFATLNKDLEHAVDPDSDPTPTDWDDPEAFVGSGHSGIKSHVIQVGNFLQVVPSEQPIISRAFVNPTPPVPAAVPLAVVSSGVPPAPVPPAISGVLPVAAPISSAVAFPSPVAPVTSSFQAISSSSPSNLSSVATLPCAIAPPLSVAPPVSPSLVSSVSTTSPIAPNIPTSIPSVASLIPALSTAVPSLPSPNPSLSQIPLLASLAPTSSCPGISQLPLDPAAFLGTLISHALALEKQQQSLLHSPSCSPLVVGQGDDTPKELPMSVEKEVRKGEKRKKMPKGNPAPQSTEKFPIEDAMSNADPLTKTIEDDFDIDPEEVALIQEAMSKVPGEEEDFGEQNNKISRLKEKRKKARVGNTVFPPATRGILIPPGIREKPSLLSGGISRGLNSGTQGQRKSVMFADGVRPGDGTSPSAGEDLPSPPPPVRKIPKEKRLRKKKKIKVKIIRQIRVESAEEDDDEDDDASPPPPPPGSPPPSLLLHHLSQHSPMGCEGAIPNPASHYPYPSAPTMPPTHAFSRLQAQQQLPPTPNAAHVATGGSAVLPPNALPPRIPQWAPCT